MDRFCEEECDVSLQSFFSFIAVARLNQEGGSHPLVSTNLEGGNSLVSTKSVKFLSECKSVLVRSCRVSLSWVRSGRRRGPVYYDGPTKETAASDRTPGGPERITHVYPQG